MVKIIRLLFILSFVTFFSNCSKEGVPVSSDKAVLLNLVNNYRLSGCNCGSMYYPPVPKVKWNDALELAANEHSEDMNNKNYFSHVGSDGSSFGERIKRYNYNWSECAENILRGYRTEKEVIEGWINSAEHCKNIMNGNFKEMGISVSGTYWTQVVASP